MVGCTSGALRDIDYNGDEDHDDGRFIIHSNMPQEPWACSRLHAEIYRSYFALLFWQENISCLSLRSFNTCTLITSWFTDFSIGSTLKGSVWKPWETCFLPSTTPVFCVWKSILQRLNEQCEGVVTVGGAIWECLHICNYVMTLWWSYYIHSSTEDSSLSLPFSPAAPTPLLVYSNHRQPWTCFNFGMIN